VLALEADGTVKGCPSLATIGFAGGNVRDLTLQDIWHNSPEIHFGRLRSVEDLWGFCRSCYYADVCRGGCTWTSHSLLGEPGNNPYCHYRALALDKQGLRERIVKIREAAKTSFAVGEFEIVTERTVDSAFVASSRTERRPEKRRSANHLPATGRIPPSLDLCRACNGYVLRDESTCVHCGSDVRAAALAHEADGHRRAAAIAEVEQQLRALDAART
jgi:radical SAM protein with 4Fe4S-binding SPASM domain